MAAVTMVLLACWLVIKAAPETPTARRLRYCLVDALVSRLNRVTRGQVMLAFSLAIFVCLIVSQLEREGLNVLALMTPEIVSWVAMFEVSIWLDAAVAAIAASTLVSLRTFGLLIQARLPRRKPRARRVRKPRMAANDDDRPRLAVAA